MKKLLLRLIALSMILTLAGCGNTAGSGDGGSDQPEVSSAQELLETVWGGYAENDKFAAMGGGFDAPVSDAPGTYPTDDAAALESTFGVPSVQAEQIDDAASLVHMMNANTFTCGAFHLTDGDKRADFAAAVKDNLMNRQWLCGFPETLLVYGIGDYVVVVFGNDEMVQTFRTQLTSAYASAEALAEESFSF